MRRYCERCGEVFSPTKFWVLTQKYCPRCQKFLSEQEKTVGAPIPELKPTRKSSWYDWPRPLPSKEDKEPEKEPTKEHRRIELV
jgi:hypothetical protein